MTRAELRTRLLDAGFTFLTTTQANDFINEAAWELVRAERWRWRLTTVAGASPLTVANLGPIESVADGQNGLDPKPRAEIQRWGVNMALAGTAAFYWVEGAAQVHSWPVSTSLSVRHFSTRAWTTGGDFAGSDADTPAAPFDFHDVIDLMARRRAKTFNDDFDEAMAMQGLIDMRLNDSRRVHLERPAPARDPEAPVDAR